LPLGLMLTALKTPSRRWAIVLGVIGADVVMIAARAFADASPSGSSAKWI
jgi:hypothetical protein